MVWLLLWRIAILLISTASVVMLIGRFYKQHKTWNAKTRDYWYALLMWSLSGVGLPVEAILRRSPFRFVLVVITAATVVTLIGVLRKGTWGNHSDD